MVPKAKNEAGEARSLKRCWLITGVIAVLGLLVTAAFILSPWDEQSYEQLQVLKGPGEFSFRVYGENVWEVGRGYYYQVWYRDEPVSGKSLFGIYEGGRRVADWHLSVTPDGSLGALVLATDPYRVYAMYDFTNGQSWPYMGRHDLKTGEAMLERLGEATGQSGFYLN